MTSTAQRSSTSGRSGLLLLVLGVAVLIVVGILTRPASYTSLPVDPENPKPGGAMAVAEILREQGVEVDVVRSRDEALDTRAQAIVITETQSLTHNDRKEIADLGIDIILVNASGKFDSLGGPIKRASIDADTTTPANCDDPRAQAGPVTSFSSGRKVEGASVCFPGPEAGHLLTWNLPSGAEVTYLSGHLLENRHLADDANAALALRVLGKHSHITWFIPTPGEIDIEETGDLSRRWVWISVVVMLVAAMWWRGPRFGRLIGEPLPVIVDASETTIGRGKLYQHSRDLTHTASRLRMGTLNRLAPPLGFSPSTDPDHIVATIAQASGWEVQTVRQLLYGPPPTTHESLQGLALSLEALEKEVDNT